MFDSQITIGQKRISNSDPVYFIADIAANHDGDIQRAKELIWLAKEAGADCAKFQHFKADKIVSDFGFRNLKTAQSHQAAWKKSVFEVYEQYHCRREWTEELYQTCQEAKIEFMTTPYDVEAVNELDRYVTAYKIGSGDITWIDYLEFVAKKNKPVLLGAGASTLEDVQRAIFRMAKYNSQIVLLQCNTNYTASLENYKNINLNVLNSFKKEFPGILLGLSDHTLGHATVLGAIALGAKVIEKHFTDDNGRVGPDHHFAMNPKTWKDMVQASRELELAMGDGIKRVEKNEQQTVIIQQRSLRLCKDKRAGEILAASDFEALRPAPRNAYLPYEMGKLEGAVLRVDKEKGDCVYKGEIDD